MQKRKDRSMVVEEAAAVVQMDNGGGFCVLRALLA